VRTDVERVTFLVLFQRALTKSVAEMTATTPMFRIQL